jgi:hypothetical protein
MYVCPPAANAIYQLAFSTPFQSAPHRISHSLCFTCTAEMTLGYMEYSDPSKPQSELQVIVLIPGSPG